MLKTQINVVAVVAVIEVVVACVALQNGVIDEMTRRRMIEQTLVQLNIFVLSAKWSQRSERRNAFTDFIEIM